MTSRFLSLLVLLVPFGAFVACSSSDDPSSADDDLIGGREARDNERPATMLVKDNCTVAKVGPRHILTAAHCVDGYNAYKFAPGATIEVTAQKKLGSYADPDAAAENPWRSVVVERTEVHPAWRDKCAGGTMTCGSVHISGRNEMADVAIVITRDPLEGIPTVAVDLAPVVPGDRVAVTGYGCEDAVGGYWDYQNRRLRVAETVAVEFDRTIHDGSFIFPDDRDTGLAKTMDGIYVITPGPNDPPADPDAGAADGGEASDAGAEDLARRGGLCPGDSGGPLYRIGERTSVVVGVNANYTFASGRTHPMGDGTDRSFMYGGSPVTNWHTRLDAQTGLKIGTWLREIGVRTTCSRGTCE